MRSLKKPLTAKAFDAGKVLDIKDGGSGLFKVGEINVCFTLDFLADELIPLVSSDLGGDRSWVIDIGTSKQTL